VSFFSEERGSELKELFFESAQELLQTLNEEGLQLEQRPEDAEIIKSARRTVHTLKGDSAACGYKELSELAHKLEDAMTAEVAARDGSRLADLVLAAADTFEAMLAAYRANSSAPNAAFLITQIENLTKAPGAATPKAAAVPVELKGAFAWTEYEQMVIADAAARGEAVYNLALEIDPNCLMREPAVQLARNAIAQLGRLLAIHPEDSAQAAKVEIIEAALASNLPADTIQKRCLIPSIISDVMVQRCAALPSTTPEDVLDLGSTPAKSSPIQSAIAASLPDPVTLSPSTPVAPAPPATIPAHADEAPEAAGELHGDAQQAAAFAVSQAIENVLRVDANRIDDVLNLVGELIIGKSMLQQTIGDFGKRFAKDPMHARLADTLTFQARVLNDLQKSVMKIRMVPVEQLFRRVPRIVRDVSKSLGKQIGLEVEGADTELDKSILDQLAEPLAHLVRNSVDHGIEVPAERIAAGKPEQGTIHLNAYHLGNQVVVEVSDDGAGIDAKKVVAKAIEKKLISADEASKMTETEQLHLIFHAGLSTADQVTQISGRGVGMDVVKTVMDRLKGTIEIRTRAGEGTTFLLKVPLTLAIIQALLFRVEEKLYAVPLESVIEITRAKETEFHRVGNQEVVQLREEVLTLVRVRRLVEGAARSGEQKVFIIIIQIADRKFGLIVDKLVGEEELVIKALDDQLVATELVSGASIRGDGSVVLILNVQSVIGRLGRNKIDASAAADAGMGATA
jgi:two-component system, chemotaxis family, sensor kinase CheA